MWFKPVFGFIKWLLSTAATPIALMVVWYFNFRPIQLMTNIVGNNSEIQTKIDSLPPATVGAINVALTVLLFNIVGHFLKKLEKPVSVKVEITDAHTDLSSAGLDFDEENVGQGRPYPLKIKLTVKVNPLFWWILENILRGVRINIIWHADWLSVSPDLRDPSNLLRLKLKPGCCEFNILRLMSESDYETKLEGKLMVLVNTGVKRQGSIDCKLRINNENSFVRWLFHWALLLTVKEEIASCNLILKKKGQ